MSPLNRPLRVSTVLMLFVVCVLWASTIAMAQNAPSGPNVILPENAVTRVSEHVYVIMGFPNVEIVVGNRATLVVDTGMGARNGATVVREAEKLAKNPRLYLTTTHFHPEHSTGEQAFPAGTVLIRPAVQQAEMEKLGPRFIELFKSRTELNKELLQDVKLRMPDILFDNEVKIDLGGVTARLFWLGAAHTQGDELIFVEEDNALLSGDIVQNKLIPGMPDEDASAKSWLTVLDKLAPLKPRYIVPDHGALGDGSLIAQQRAFLLDIQGRALELKRQGKSVDEAGQMLATEFKAKYPDWTGGAGGIPNVVRRVYAESQ
jgi:glyoxylase-like metal-dependent hydrolase (beta-lactamase superfamily II)